MDPGALRDTSNHSSGSLTIHGGASIESEVSKTFESLDTEAVGGKPAWMYTGAQQAEAGFQDPTLGWVGVRAKVNGSGIHAVVIPNTADAAQALGVHLEGLNTFLVTQQTTLESLTVAAPEGHTSALDADAQSQQGMNQGAHQQPDQGTHRDDPIGQGTPNRNSLFVPMAIANSVRQSQEDMANRTVEAQGTHISVIA
jgi:hypothetical protein